MMRLLAAVSLAALGPAGLAGQTWNDSATTALIARAAARRASAEADTGLRDFEARAHGFVFFLGQLGEGLAAPPRLIKADQLALEVYWKAPGRSKQRIVGWRDRRDLPTDIQYHRDHLGIVTNGFGNRIRIGEGDEVRDVPHPLAPGAARWYDYALADSLTIEIPQRLVRVYEVLVRPKEPAAPRLVGTLYLDADEAQLVRMRFQFTRSAYLDESLEDITIVLDNGLWDGRYWLPRQQEIEIRRHTTWLELPARGIIRGRWEIGDYRFNTGLADQLFAGPEIAAAAAEARSTYPWPQPLDAAIAEAGDLAALKQARLERLRAAHGNGFTFEQVDFSDQQALEAFARPHRFTRIVHLGAQAGDLDRRGCDARRAGRGLDADLLAGRDADLRLLAQARMVPGHGVRGVEPTGTARRCARFHLVGDARAVAGACLKHRKTEKPKNQKTFLSF